MLYQVTTNEGVFYVETTKDKLRRRMKEYVCEEIDEGRRLADIRYEWSPITVMTKSLP